MNKNKKYIKIKLFVKKKIERSSKKKREARISRLFKRGWKRGESKCTWEQKKKSTRGLFRKGGATA